MALINCPKCSGMVSTKAPACPHCGAASLHAMSDRERLEKLANELGSMSAAVARMEEEREVVEVHEHTRPESPVSSKQPQQQAGSFADLVLHSVCWIISIGLVGAFLFLKLDQYFTKPDSTSQSNPTPNGTYIPPGNWQLKEPPPTR